MAVPNDMTLENDSRKQDLDCSSLLSALPRCSPPVGAPPSPHGYSATVGPEKGGTEDTSELYESLRLAREEINMLRSMVSLNDYFLLTFVPTFNPSGPLPRSGDGH